jgi:amino acid transporter
MSMDSRRLLPDQWSAPIQMVAGGMIIFLAYEGFELIANTADDVQHPAKTLPRAFYSAVGFVICLYIMVEGVYRFVKKRILQVPLSRKAGPAR